MTSVDRPWPPLIIVSNVPQLIRWRDLLLTFMMWIAFAVMLETEFELFLGDHLERLGFGDFDTDPNWLIFFERLTPFLLTIALLISLLGVASIRTLQRRRRALLLPMPAPLELAEECRRSGLDEQELTSARASIMVIVHIDADGRHRIEA